MFRGMIYRLLLLAPAWCLLAFANPIVRVSQPINLQHAFYLIGSLILIEGALLGVWLKYKHFIPTHQAAMFGVTLNACTFFLFFPLLKVTDPLQFAERIFIAEALIVNLEAVAIYFFCKNRLKHLSTKPLTLGKAFALSAVLNLISFLPSVLIPY
jgi:hypothetical protein